MRTLLKHSAETLLCRSGLTRVARTRRGGAVVLAYHNVVPTGETTLGDRSLHLPQREFAAQLDLIRRTHDVVPLESVLEGGERGRRPRVAITFDDAYAGALSAGVGELSSRGLPATIFVAPGLLGRSFWWDVAGEGNGLTPGERRYALEGLGGRDAAIRRWAGAGGRPIPTPPPHQHAASEARLAEVAADGLFTLASHTWSHPNLAALPEDAVEDELARPLAWLLERFPHKTLRWITYPYGISSPAVREMTRRVGYHAAMRVDGGSIGRRATDRFALPRLNVPAGASLSWLELRTAGGIRPW